MPNRPKSSNRGGARKGAGRPRIPGDTRPTNLKLSIETIEMARRIGNGIVSAGVARAVQHYMLEHASNADAAQGFPKPLSALPFPYDWADPAVREMAQEVAKAREEAVHHPPFSDKSHASSRKSARLGLSFPYDWSNPEMTDEMLIRKVLERGIFADISIVCHYFEFEKVMAVYKSLPKQTLPLKRMLHNISEGLHVVAR